MGKRRGGVRRRDQRVTREVLRRPRPLWSLFDDGELCDKRACDGSCGRWHLA